MQPDQILQSDVLDIIFENRNKSYGAYTLRKYYDRRMLGSVIVVVTAILIWFLFSFFKAPEKRNLSNILRPVQDSTKLIDIIDPPPPPPPPPPPQPMQQVATVDNRTIRIVPDNLADSTPPSTVDDMNKAVIGTQNIAGKEDDGIPPPVDDARKGGIIEPPRQAEEPEVYIDAQVMHRFPGGPDALVRFLKSHMRTPEEAMDAGSRIVVKARFVVQKDGSIGGIEILQSGGKTFDEEVLRVVNKMPDWTPGSQNGRNVAVYFTLPIVFEATEE